MSIPNNYFHPQLQPYGSMTDRYGVATWLTQEYVMASEKLIAYDLKTYNSTANQNGLVDREEYLNPHFTTDKIHEAELYKQIKQEKRAHIFDSIDIDGNKQWSLAELVAANIALDPHGNLIRHWHENTIEQNRQIFKDVLEQNQLNNPILLPQRPYEEAKPLPSSSEINKL